MFLHIHRRARQVRTNLHINSNVSTFQTATLTGGTFRVIICAKSAGRYVIETMKILKAFFRFQSNKTNNQDKDYMRIDILH